MAQTQDLPAPDLPAEREEVELWREEAGVARAEAVDARKRLESEEENAAAVLHETAEVKLSSSLAPLVECTVDAVARICSDGPRVWARLPPAALGSNPRLAGRDSGAKTPVVVSLERTP